MELTNHNLDTDTVQIDYKALIFATKIAVKQLQLRIRQDLDQTQQDYINNNITPRLYLVGNRIKDNSRHLAFILETYYTLIQGKERSKKELINVE